MVFATMAATKARATAPRARGHHVQQAGDVSQAGKVSRPASHQGDAGHGRRQASYLLARLPAAGVALHAQLDAGGQKIGVDALDEGPGLRAPGAKARQGSRSRDMRGPPHPGQGRQGLAGGLLSCPRKLAVELTAQARRLPPALDDAPGAAGELGKEPQ